MLFPLSAVREEVASQVMVVLGTEMNGAVAARRRCILLLEVRQASCAMGVSTSVVRVRWWRLEGEEWRRCGCCILRGR